MQKLRPVRALIGFVAIAPVALAAQGATRRAAPDCDGGLVVPAGFCAQLFAERIGAARHVVVARNGDVLVNTNPSRAGAESGTGSGPGGGLVLLRDTNGDGHAELVKKLGGFGGTGIAIGNGYLWATDRNHIVRYHYAVGDTMLGAADTIIRNLPPDGNHTAYNFVINGNTLYLNVGSRTNSCQEKDRQLRSKGLDPCTELAGRGGIWTFDANRRGQTFENGERFATGIRNAVGLAWNGPASELWTMMHGRDQLSMNWGFSDEYNAENPAEELLQVKKGDDFGWPYCYFSNEVKMLVLAPEYGGDGRQVGRCAGKKEPVYAFPGHWAPNGLLFYTGGQFPEAWRNGAFVVFHGSWNRAPMMQDGFRVSFLPLHRGKAAGAPRTFADGFAADYFKGKKGAVPPSADYRNHRPSGIAQSPDGALFVTDDLSGTVYKISYLRK